MRMRIKKDENDSMREKSSDYKVFGYKYFIDRRRPSVSMDPLW